MSENSSPSHSSGHSLSLSPDLLPENAQNAVEDEESISEHIENSLEHDRSVWEIEINNIPNLETEANIRNISRTPTDSLNSSYEAHKSALKNARSIMEEILHNDQFKSTSEHLNSNDDSFDVFQNVNLDDDSINNFVTRSNDNYKECPVVLENNCLQEAKRRSLEEAVSTKDSIIAALNVEIESLREFASNPSTMSLNTTLTEYKQLYDECNAKLVNYESAVQQRDGLIKELQDALNNSEKCKMDLHKECERYSKDISSLQKELADALEFIKLSATNSKCVSHKEADLEVFYEKLKGKLSDELLADIKMEIAEYVERKLSECRSLQKLEIDNLQSKHVKEMDNTREYYEKKCADILSDEITSSRSRKLSESSSSEEELNLDFVPGPGGDGATPLKRKPKVWTAKDAQHFKAQVQKATVILDKYNLEILTDEDLETLQDDLSCTSLLKTTKKNKVFETETNDVSVQAQSGDFEIDGIVYSYQVQLNQQIALAKHDLARNLQEKIITLANSNCNDADWPKEFLEIKRKLSEKYTKEIDQLKVQHADEVKKLKQDQIRTINKVHKNSMSSEEEQDTQWTTLKNILMETQKYFSECEDELNNTLLEEFTKAALTEESDVSNIELSNSSSKSESENPLNPQKRLHLTPNIGNFIDKIEKSNPDVSSEFRTELEECLKRLRNDANGILALTLKAHQGDTTQQQVKVLTKLNEELDQQLSDAQICKKTLEKERLSLEKQLEEQRAQSKMLLEQLSQARNKIDELVEYSRKETVSEGFGEINVVDSQNESFSLEDLQEKAKLLLGDRKMEGNIQQVVGDLCKYCEKVLLDAKKERLDFTMQIESADKKLKATQKFLEDQASEREQERDEAQKSISKLREQLKERDKDRVGYERVNEEAENFSGSTYQELTRQVEGFEVQMRKMSQLMVETEKRYQEVESERNEAVDRIAFLRGIITDLEKQIDIKAEVESELKAILDKQREVNEELVAQLEASNSSSNFQLQISQLEEEVTKLRRTNEIVGNEGLIKQIQLQLHDLETTVDKGNREIEALYASHSSCSSPSEEMSVQDQIRPKTPNTTLDDCEVPLQQLSRLKEKLFKHTRAEQAALKRIQDLETQLSHSKSEIDELTNEKNLWQNERTVLQERISEQLILVSSLQIRLDQQRLRIEETQKQANASLELRIYDLENEVQQLKDKLRSKEVVIKQLNVVVEETKQRLKDREDELSATIEESEVFALKQQLEKAKNENELLRIKMESDVQNAQILPGLVDNIIADKNKDINALKDKLQEAESQLNLYLTMNSDKAEKQDQRGVLSFVNLTDSPEQMRHLSQKGDSLLNATCVPEISSIEKIGPANVNYTIDFLDAPKTNSTELQKSKKVHFEDETSNLWQEKLTAVEKNLEELREKLQEEQENCKELRVNLAETKMHLSEKEKLILVLQEDGKRKDEMFYELAKEKRDLEKQMDTLDDIRENVEQLQKLEDDLKHQLAVVNGKYEEKAICYEKLSEEFRTYKERESEKLFSEKQSKEACLKDANEEIAKLKKLLLENEETVNALNAKIAENELLLKDLRENHDKPNQLQEMKFQKELGEKDLRILKLQTALDDLKRELMHLQDYLNEKDKIIETMKADGDSLRANLVMIKSKMNESGNVYDLRKQLQKEREINAQLSNNLMSTSIDEVAEEVKKQLDDSQDLDEAIINALTSGDVSQMNDADLKRVILHERQCKSNLESKVEHLERLLDDAQTTIGNLQKTVEEQKRICNQIQLEDSEVLEQMRIKLEQAIRNDAELKSVLLKEQEKYSVLESEFSSLRRKEQFSTSSNSKTEYRTLSHMETVRLQDEVSALQKTNVALKSEVKSLKKSKNFAETGLKHTKELLNIKGQEIEKLQERIRIADDEIKQLREHLLRVQNEVTERNRELENTKQLIEDLEHEKLELKTKFTLLTLNKPARDDVNMNDVIPEEFLQKIKDLGELVTEHIRENKVMTETVVKLTEERNSLQDKLRDRRELPVPFNDPISRANHLFGKYLRADSFKNALTFQKKYLIGLLASYQDLRGHPLGKFQPKRPLKTQVNRFRVAAVVCISITRMKFMVQRWHSSSRRGAYFSLQRKFQTQEIETHFQVGQPVSSEHFRNTAGFPRRRPQRSPSPSTPTSTRQEEKPWSGSTPPSRDRATFSLHANRDILAVPDSNLDTYFERFDQIEQRLGIVLSKFDNK